MCGFSRQMKITDHLPRVNSQHYRYLHYGYLPSPWKHYPKSCSNYWVLMNMPQSLKAVINDTLQF